MPADPRPFKQTVDEAIERILRLDASAYGTTGNPAKWRRSTDPLTVLQDASSRGHLNFSVWLQSAPNGEMDRDAESGGIAMIFAAMKVAFTYRLRPTKREEDAVMATEAALDVIKVLMTSWSADTPCIVIHLINGLQPSITLDNEWVMIVQDYQAEFEIDLSNPPLLNSPE